MKYILCIFLIYIICGCSTFTTKKVMAIKQGMSSNEILKMFGEPDDIMQTVCGKEEHKWNCTIWDYESGDILLGTYETASFTFSGEPGNYILNNFSVNR